VRAAKQPVEAEVLIIYIPPGKLKMLI